MEDAIIDKCSDDEASFDALHRRIAATIDFLLRVDPSGYQGREHADVVVSVPGKSVHYQTRDYLLAFALPNFWFHVTTAYDILRASGVPIGRRHYLVGNKLGSVPHDGEGL